MWTHADTSGAIRPPWNFTVFSLTCITAGTPARSAPSAMPSACSSATTLKAGTAAPASAAAATSSPVDARVTLPVRGGKCGTFVDDGKLAQSAQYKATKRSVKLSVCDHRELSAMSIKRTDRMRQVLSLLRDRGEVTSQLLSDELRVSVATLRRDLGELEEQGLLV